MVKARIHFERLFAGPTVRAAIAAVARRSDPAVLDRADTQAGRGRYTILAADPLEILSTLPGHEDPFETLRSRLARFSSPTGANGPSSEHEHAAELPFQGGWIGYFAYEAGHHIERIAGLAERDLPLPISRWGLYDSAAIHDALRDEWLVVAADLRPLHSRAPDPTARIAEWKRILQRAAEPLLATSSPTAGSTVENMSFADYLGRVRRAKDYIAAGDVFQVNLARRFSLPQREPAIVTYLRLRERNPAAYAAFLSWDDGRTSVLSASPELFLAVRGREVVTRPIKGTRPRSADPIVDDSLQSELLASEKDRAELAMIVDLQRNDLGRVCEYDSVRVARPFPARGEEPGSRRCTGVPTRLNRGLPAVDRSQTSFATLETHPTVHHLVASVTGRLRAECDLIDLLRATFPGGSITGAPEVRAMQIIDELEPMQRSVYTGSIGCISLDGQMTLNIAIRTLIATQGWIHAYVGGGIVADSDPHEEYAETTAKAAGLCRALGVGANDENPSAVSSRERGGN